MNRRDLNRRLEPNRKFVEPGRHGPVLLETADPAFDRVPGLVVLAVEDGRTATATAAAPAVADLIDRLRNRAPDATSAQARFAREEYALSPRTRSGRLLGRPTCLRWRNANARHPDVLAAQRKERARIRSDKGIRWGGRPLPAAA